MAKKTKKPAAKAKPAAAKKEAPAKKAAGAAKAATRTFPRERVTGIGGVFFRAKDPGRLAAWYEAHLGVDVQEWGGAAFEWIDPARPKGRASTVWSPFEATTKYFGPGKQGHMINYRVKDLDAMLAQLEDAGVPLAREQETSAHGRFAWGIDPDGNRFELWEPPAGK